MAGFFDDEDDLEELTPGEDPFELHFDDERSEPSTLDRWRRNTASGAIIGAVALGLQQVFDPESKKATVAVEQEAPTRPVDPGRIELRFDPLDSRNNSVVVHPPANGG